jgi:DNA-binding FrmR family transcriptional regulator
MLPATGTVWILGIDDFARKRRAAGIEQANGVGSLAGTEVGEMPVIGLPARLATLPGRPPRLRYPDLGDRITGRKDVDHPMHGNALHHTHPEIIKRLRRTEGHIRSIIEMLESGRACLDVAQQLYAVEKAISQAKKTLIHDHLDDCLESAVGESTRAQSDAIQEFKEITKYL